MSSAQLRCSICNESTATNRIIVETCGHQKCRGCFIREEDGCSICIAASASLAIGESRHHVSSAQPEDLSANCIPTIDQDKRVKIIENVLISTRTNDKNKSHKTTRSKHSRPAHITVAKDDNGKVIAYTCTICKKRFKSRNNQQYHFYCDTNQPKPFQCGRCTKQFITQSHLTYHEQTHENKMFRCTACDRVFAGEIGLRKHARKHTNEFKYECNVCDQRFRYRDQLRAHENRHNNVFHTCTECAMQFLIKSNLTKHMLTHAGKNQEMCSICRKMYSGKSALKVHMLTHSNHRQFKCDSCVKAFIDQRTLDRHLRTHSSNYYYECSLCRARSTRKDNIRRHVRNIHTGTGVDVQTILDEIFRKYSDRNKQTDVDGSTKLREDETEKTPEKLETTTKPNPAEQCNLDERQQVKNTPMSVIKFVGKTSASIDATTNESQSGASTSTEIGLSKPDQSIVRTGSNTEVEAVSAEWMPTYQPLTLDPIPQMEPLPLLTTHNNSNLSVYRQLLSPYLRRSN